MKTFNSNLICQLLILVTTMVWFASCTPVATPYQPKHEGYGYEESRLQQNLYRVSFRANRYTSETDVMDYLYLRSAELAKAAGYAHFLVVQDLSKSQMEGERTPRFRIGLGFSSSSRHSMVGAGFSSPFGESETRYSVRYHLGVLLIRMLTEEEAQNEKNSIEVDYLLESLREKYYR